MNQKDKLGYENDFIGNAWTQRYLDVYRGGVVTRIVAQSQANMLCMEHELML